MLPSTAPTMSWSSTESVSRTETAAGVHGADAARLAWPDMLVFADLLEVRAHNLLRHQAERVMAGSASVDGADHLSGSVVAKMNITCSGGSSTISAAR